MNPLASITSAKMHWKKTPPGASIFKKEYEVEKAGSAEYDGNVHGGVPMKFVHVTNENFEDIFEVSAKYEQWQYVKHHIFDMVDNYAAIVNEAYLPIPFLVYEEERLIGFVQVNMREGDSGEGGCSREEGYSREESHSLFCEIRKLIVHETEQNRGYGTKILREVTKWACNKFGISIMTAHYMAENQAADRLFSKVGFRKRRTGDHVTVVIEFETGGNKSGPGDDTLACKYKEISEFTEIPYRNIRDFACRIKALKKYPQGRIGADEGIHFRKISMDDCRQITQMQLLESQEEYVMPFVDSLAQSYSDLFESEITVTYALHNGDNPVGLMEIYYGRGSDFPGLNDRPVYELFRILVDKDSQGKGYGTKAVQLFLDYVKEKPLGEAEDVVVSVVEGNDAALKLYEKFGFTVFGRDKYGHTALRCSRFSA